MVLSNLDKAVMERQTAKRSIDWLRKKVVPGLTEAIIDMYTADTQAAKQDVADVYRKILATQPADMAPHDIEDEALKDAADAILQDLVEQKAAAVAKRAPSSSGSTSGMSTGGTGSLIRLPRVDLPSFTGDLKEWMSFKDLFQSAVDKNSSITDAQKLTYLQSCLSGEGSRLLASIDCTNANYKIARDLLEGRHQNERVLIFSILKRFTG